MNKISKKFSTKVSERFLAATDGPSTPIIQLEAEFSYLLDEQRLSKAVVLTMDAEPILGCRFVPRMIRRPYWERVEKERADVFTLTKDKSEYEAFRNKGIDFFSEPQIFACLYRSESGDRLILKISHLVSDAAGVRDIAAILSAIYNRLADEPDFCPNPNLNSSRSLWHIFRHVPWYAHPRIFFNYLHEMLAASIPYKTHSLSIENASENAGRYMTRHISKEKVTNMVRYAKAYNATVNDLLLTAIFRALSKTGEWDTRAALRITVTVDLRRYLPERNAESIANFSSIEILTYGTVMEDSFEATLTRVVGMVGKRKSSWLGLSPFSSLFMSMWPLPFSILKKITKKICEFKSHTSNSFDLYTNMGNIPLEDINLGGSPARAWLLPPGCSMPLLLFGCSGYDGALTLSASVMPDAVDTVEKFFDLIVSELPLTNRPTDIVSRKGSPCRNF